MLRRTSIAASSALALLTLSCSGADKQDVLVGTGTNAANSSNGSNGSNTTTGSSGNNSPGNSNPGSSSGDTPSKECGDKNREVEPNDGRQDATPLSPLLCGTLSRDDVRDYVQFRLKQRTTEMFIRFEGQIRLSVTVPGHTTFEMSATNSPNIPIVKDEDYSVEISALEEEAESTAWRVELVERP